MGFVLSKLFGFFVSPTNLALFCLSAGLVLGLSRFGRAARVLMVTGALVLVLFAVTPLPRLMAGVLEDRFPLPAVNDPRPVAGIVVLGGAIGETRGQTTFTRAASRMTEAVALALRYPDARLVFTGGSGALLAQEETTEAAAASRFFTALGIDPKRLVLEDQSRNTLENAVLTAKLIAPKPGERWLLITSALHMPRSVALFRKVGLDLEPWPVDFRTSGTLRDLISPGRAFSTNLTLADSAAREWVGLIVARLSGHSDSVLPER
jgi:uncharacterized SAM-binding protein YcdF (DUF218 family)